MSKVHLYQERLSSLRTLVLFLVFTLLFGFLLIWRTRTAGFDAWSVFFLCFTVIFFFYTLNYRILVIQITPQALKLKFGVFTWTEQLDNIEGCTIDKLPWLLEYGGAGIHFMNANNRYRASFNFLEYPRLVIALKQKRGPVRDLSFSTRQPEEIIPYICSSK